MNPTCPGCNTPRAKHARGPICQKCCRQRHYARIAGHNRVTFGPDYILQRVRIDGVSGCWIWIGAKCKDGYGKLEILECREIKSHRASYVLWKGEIEEGLTLHHTCFNRSCVNPSHLIPMTADQNKRTRQPKTHCPHDHEYTEENTSFDRKGSRCCRMCKRLRERKRYALARAAEDAYRASAEKPE